MDYRQSSKTGPVVSALGLGAMGMSGIYGPADRAESIATIHAALDAGITLIDTGDFYGMGHNEMLIAEALKGRDRDKALLSVKFGALRDPAGGWLGFDARPAAMKTFLAYTLQRLNIDYIDIYRPARLDPHVPIEDTIGAIADMIKAGYVRHIGLVGGWRGDDSPGGGDPPDRRSTDRIFPDLTRGIEDAILPACRELGIGITAYGVLARGLIGGHWDKNSVAPGDYRAATPRFQAENIDQNLSLVDALRVDCRGAGRHRRASRDRLGGGARGRYHPGGRRPQPREADRGAGCAGCEAWSRRFGRDRTRRSEGGRRGRPLSRRPDGASGQRAPIVGQSVLSTALLSSPMLPAVLAMADRQVSARSGGSETAKRVT